MKHAAFLGRWRWGAFLAILCLVATPVVYYHLFPLGLSVLKIAYREDKRHSELSSYVVTLEGKVLENVPGEASDLVYNAESDTLFLVARSRIVEISTSGEWLRTIDVAGVKDLEGIAAMGQHRFLIADERTRRICWITLEAGLTRVDVAQAPCLRLDLMLADRRRSNKGFEGLAWDARDNRLFVANEKYPARILLLEGASFWRETKFIDLAVFDWPFAPNISPSSELRDISALAWHPETSRLWVLSDESRMLVVFDAQGRRLGFIPLWRGWHGLERSIPQPEGVAIDRKGAVYIVSEPNLFYRFEPRTRSITELATTDESSCSPDC
jgi:uncharacterized protein YjiK